MVPRLGAPAGQGLAGLAGEVPFRTCRRSCLLCGAAPPRPGGEHAHPSGCRLVLLCLCVVVVVDLFSCFFVLLWFSVFFVAKIEKYHYYFLKIIISCFCFDETFSDILLLTRFRWGETLATSFHGFLFST